MEKTEIDAVKSFSQPEAFGANYQTLLLEQYKLYVETTNKVSDRRGSAHTLLLTVNTSLVTIYGLVLAKDTTLATAKGPWTWMIPLVGLLVAVTWFLLIRSYRALNGAKFRVIHEVENRLPARLFDLEWQFLDRGRTLVYQPLTHLEQYIPIVFAVFYIVLLVVTVHIY